MHSILGQGCLHNTIYERMPPHAMKHCRGANCAKYALVCTLFYCFNFSDHHHKVLTLARVIVSSIAYNVPSRHHACIFNLVSWWRQMFFPSVLVGFGGPSLKQLKMSLEESPTMYRANQSKHMQEDARRQRERSSSSIKRENRTLVQSGRADARPRQKNGRLSKPGRRGRSSKPGRTLVHRRENWTFVQLAEVDVRPDSREDARPVDLQEDARPAREEALVHRGTR
ncbi:hypothetical protein LR48_Vigan07g051700 [Vigna angularis]|uniref:Uncharacterized protein n=1 Tax=Phaseolus angularis TaxID=3914 RepID=A0A0L9UVM5_PHAAN|nr:hypothetical protein LR48_Vigan07g051700 [Vigna angularis]